MKKSILQFSVIAAIAASMTLTTSCSSDESVAEAYVPEPVNFSIGMSDMSVKAGTRSQDASSKTGWTASIDGKLAVDNLVFICMKDADNKFYRKAYKVSSAASSNYGPNTLTENTSGAIGKFYWHEKNEYKQYQVFSFGNSTITGYENTSAGDLTALPSTYTYTVPSDQTDENNKTEFLFGYGTLYNDASSGTKALEASHQLARIDVTLETEKNKVTVTEDQDGNSLSLDPNNTPGDTSDDITSFNPTTAEDFELKIGWAQMMLKGVFTPNTYSIENTGAADHIHSGSSAATETGSWAAPGTGEEKGQITPRVLEKQRYNTSTEKFETQYSAVVMPQEFTGKDLFTIKYDGATYKYTIPATPTFTIEPGKHYKYKVRLQGTNISVSVAIQAWSPVDYTTSPVEAKLQ